jgi:hypothetical protein
VALVAVGGRLPEFGVDRVPGGLDRGHGPLTCCCRAARYLLVLVGGDVVDEPADDLLTEGGVVDGVQDEGVPAVVDQLARYEGVTGLPAGGGDERGGLADDAARGLLVGLRVVRW